MTNLDIVNPFNSEKISSIKLESREQAFQKLETAFKIHKEHPYGLPKEQRIKILEKFHELLEANQEELIQISLSEGENHTKILSLK